MRYCENISEISKEYLQSFGHIMNIVQKEINTRNLEYLDIQNLHEPGAERLVFDILTTDLNSGKKRVVHVDFISSAPTVEQFLDCVYGSGSTSDHKIIIYDNHCGYHADLRDESPFYFVTRMIEKCNAVDISFEVIRYHHPSKRTEPSWHYYSSNTNREAVNAQLQSGPLPTKRDIQGMAFWALYFTIYRQYENYELHQLHCERSFDTCISGDLCVFAKWTDEGLIYVISDRHHSEFIPWLWNNRKEYLEKSYPGFKLSTCRNGKHSYICVHANNTPFHELQKMRYSERERLKDHLFHNEDINEIEVIVRNAQKQYETEIEQIKTNLKR